MAPHRYIPSSSAAVQGERAAGAATPGLYYGLFAFFLFTRKIPVIQDEVPNLNYYWVPLLTVVIGAYLIAHGFFSVYAMCVDTLFLCFCDDLERNDGSSEKPFLMSPELHRILGKS
ncbi:choline transporter-like protein 5-A, partial [Lates japonicus]